MKRFFSLVIILLFAVILPACNTPDLLQPGDATESSHPTTNPLQEPLQPGDAVGAFLITTSTPEEVVFSWEHDDIAGEAITGPVTNVKWGTKINVSIGVYAPAGGNLDTTWDESTYDLFINDLPVDLEAFGSFEITNPIVGKMRIWNVTIEATEPGAITVYEIGVVDRESFEYTTTYNFLPPE